MLKTKKGEVLTSLNQKAPHKNKPMFNWDKLSKLISNQWDLNGCYPKSKNENREPAGDFFISVSLLLCSKYLMVNNN